MSTSPFSFNPRFLRIAAPFFAILIIIVVGLMFFAERDDIESDLSFDIFMGQAIGSNFHQPSDEELRAKLHQYEPIIMGNPNDSVVLWRVSSIYNRLGEHDSAFRFALRAAGSRRKDPAGHLRAAFFGRHMLCYEKGLSHIERQMILEGSIKSAEIAMSLQPDAENDFGPAILVMLYSMRADDLEKAASSSANQSEEAQLMAQAFDSRDRAERAKSTWVSLRKKRYGPAYQAQWKSPPCP
jgi:hypothetical protein